MVGEYMGPNVYILCEDCIFYAPASIDRGIKFLPCLFVCLFHYLFVRQKTFTLTIMVSDKHTCHNFFKQIRDNGLHFPGFASIFRDRAFSKYFRDYNTSSRYIYQNGLIELRSSSIKPSSRYIYQNGLIELRSIHMPQSSYIIEHEKYFVLRVVVHSFTR